MISNVKICVFYCDGDDNSRYCGHWDNYKGDCDGCFTVCGAAEFDEKEMEENQW